MLVIRMVRSHRRIMVVVRRFILSRQFVRTRQTFVRTRKKINCPDNLYFVHTNVVDRRAPRTNGPKEPTVKRDKSQGPSEDKGQEHRAKGAKRPNRKGKGQKSPKPMVKGDKRHEPKRHTGKGTREQSKRAQSKGQRGSRWPRTMG